MKAVAPAALLMLLVPGGSAAASPSSTCGPNSTNVTDCDHPDLGSCGNACCGAEFWTAFSASAIYDQVKAFLQGGGDSKAFEYVTGKDAASSENPGDDLRPYNIEKPHKFQFVLQGRHTTSGKHYLDTLDINVRQNDDGFGTVVRMFSISNIHGALGDHGQNYKTLAYIANALKLDRSKENIIYGCGKMPARSPIVV